MNIAPASVKKLLLRSTNWIGDAIMTLPAVYSIRQRFPNAEITVLAKEWVAEIFRICPAVNRLIILADKERHSGIGGKLTLARELRQEGFDAAILLQNAISAAIIAALAGIPVRAGYNTDGRAWLLTHRVQLRRETKKLHQTQYYLKMVHELGCLVPDNPDLNKYIALSLPDAYNALASARLAQHGVRNNTRLIGIAPGAAYGLAKRWLPERFAALTALLNKKFGATTLLLGSSSDKPITNAIAQAGGGNIVNLAGQTTLKEAMALMNRCSLFIANDSGLMHIAGALNLPLVALFGSTNHITTAPLGSRSLIVRHEVNCAPCLRQECPTDFRCMKLISVDEVFAAACRVMEQK